MTAQPRSFQNWAANVQHLQPRMGRARAGAGAGVRLYAGPPAAEGEAAEGPHCVRWARSPLQPPLRPAARTALGPAQPLEKAEWEEVSCRHYGRAAVTCEPREGGGARFEPQRKHNTSASA